MSMWSTGQNDVIRELGYKGASVVRDEIIERYGVVHTLRAVEIQASRIHASLKVLTECPECHGMRLNKEAQRLITVIAFDIQTSLHIDIKHHILTS